MTRQEKAEIIMVEREVMPVTKERRGLYPKDWQEISRRIRFERAGGLCENCKAPHGEVIIRYPGESTNWRFIQSPEYDPSDDPLGRGTAVKIVLTTAHLNHDPQDNRDENLRALCQRCHLRHDAEHHQQNAARRRRSSKNNLDLFEES